MDIELKRRDCKAHFTAETLLSVCMNITSEIRLVVFRMKLTTSALLEAVNCAIACGVPSDDEHLVEKININRPDPLGQHLVDNHLPFV